TALRESLQRRFSGDANPKVATIELRHCRIDRAFFDYPERGTRSLHFEGISLQNGATPLPAVNLALHNQSRQVGVFPIPVGYRVLNGLTALRSPLRELQLKVASTPALDGVRLDDIVFGPQGQATLEGKWIGPAQAEIVDSVLTPVLVEHTRG